MTLEELKEHWNRFGEVDPLWAILTNPEKAGNRWNPEDFFRGGRDEITNVMAFIDGLQPPVARDRALDFGCGVGRLTQALAAHFERADGVDIAPSMIGLARKFNHFGDRCAYHLNAAGDLSLFGADSFDLIYSVIVLQHMEPQFALNYIADFARILRPGGVFIFQVPDEIRPHKAMPDAACLARIQLKLREISAEADQVFTLPVRITNLSSVLWEPSQDCKIRLGNHWLDSDGKVVRYDDARVDLPGPLKAGESVEVEISVKAPGVPQTCILEFDVMQEFACWFKDKGSSTTMVVVNVSPSAFAPGSKDVVEPKMEMYGIAKSRVLEVIERNGCKVIDVKQDASAGSDWISYRYIARKI